jgi:hypothetical protein
VSRAVASDFTTLREGSLHAALKARYAATVIDARVEAAVDGFVVDVAGRDELVEIQTASFASARRKLERLVGMHRVVLVHPIPIEKWLVVVDADGVMLRRRRSPRRGLALDLFDELVSIPGLIAHPNFRIELALTCEEEIRGPIPSGARYRYPRAWWRLDRRLVDVVETRRVDTPADLLSLLPADLPEPFTTADIVAATGRSKRLAMRAVYCLERSGAIARLARRGRFVTYCRSGPFADGPRRGRLPEAPAACSDASRVSMLPGPISPCGPSRTGGRPRRRAPAGCSPDR